MLTQHPLPHHLSEPIPVLGGIDSSHVAPLLGWILVSEPVLFLLPDIVVCGIPLGLALGALNPFLSYGILRLAARKLARGALQERIQAVFAPKIWAPGTDSVMDDPYLPDDGQAMPIRRALKRRMILPEDSRS